MYNDCNGNPIPVEEVMGDLVVMPDLAGCYCMSEEFREWADSQDRNGEDCSNSVAFPYCLRHIARCEHCRVFNARWCAGEIDLSGNLAGSDAYEDG
jgi:hypothetical protein